jgi:hypothetical protein
MEPEKKLRKGKLGRRKPITVQFRGEKPLLEALVRAKVLTPYTVSGGLVFSLQDIANLHVRNCELSKTTERIQDLLNEEMFDD